MSESIVEAYRRAYDALIAAGQKPVKAVFDQKTGNCTVCGKCLLCPGWHTEEESKP